MKHREEDTAPTGAIYQMIKSQEHVYIDWKSHLQMLTAKQYNMTRRCDYAFGKLLAIPPLRDCFQRKRTSTLSELLWPSHRFVPCLPSSSNDESRILHGSSILTGRLLRLSEEGSSRNGSRYTHIILNSRTPPNDRDILDSYISNFYTISSLMKVYPHIYILIFLNDNNRNHQ